MESPLLPCKGCNAPAPAVTLPLPDGEVLREASYCAPCKARMFHDPEPEPEAPPGAEPITRICLQCGHEFQGARVHLLGRTFDYGTFCESCTTLQRHGVYTDPKDPRYIAACKAKWEATCPAYYRDELVVAAQPPEAITAVTAARKAQIDAGTGTGLWLFGPSGAFKTTLVFNQAVKHIIFRKGKTVVYAMAAEWRQRMVRASRLSLLDEALKPYIQADWLFLDDVGNMAGAGKEGVSITEEALITLLEARKRARRPLLTTSQFSPTDLMTKFSNPETGAGIVRRLLQSAGEPIPVSLKTTP